MITMNGITVLVLMLIFYQTEGRLPGFQARITKNGLNYANSVAHAILASQLKTLKIPDQSGDNDDIRWTLSNIQNKGYAVPNSNMTFAPDQNGLTWALSNLDLSLHADWHAEFHKGFIKIPDSGSIDIHIKSVSVQVTIKLGDDGKGRPSIFMASCNADINDVDLEFHGGIAFILNLFKGIIGDKVRDIMKGQICSIIQKEVNDDGTGAISKLKVTVLLLDHFVLDYGLIQAPNVTTDYLQTEHKGEVYWNGTMTEAPFSPKPFPSVTKDTRMLYFWVSEYTANTMAYVGQKHKFFQYNLTADDLPPDNRSFFNTSCTLACIGKLIPQIGKQYPNSKVELRMASTSIPVFVITEKNFTCNTRSNISMFAHTPDGKVPYLLTLAMNLSMSVEVSIVNEKVTGKIVDHRFQVKVLKSAVGPLDSAVLNLILKGAITLFIIPQVNEIAGKGVDLPVTDGVKFENTGITLMNGSFVIGTDLQYNNTSNPHTENGNSLRFKSEYSVRLHQY